MQYWVVLNSACCTFNTIVLQRSQFMANVSAVSPRCFFFFFKYEGMWTGLHIDVKHLLNLKRLFDFLFFFCYYTENSRSKFKMEQKLQLLQLSFLSIMNPSFSTSVNFCLRGVTLRSLKLDFSFWQRQDTAACLFRSAQSENTKILIISGQIWHDWASLQTAPKSLLD